MRTRLRLGSAAAVGLGALLLATVLASPAFAWESTVTANAFCKDDLVRVHWTVTPFEQGHKATVDISYQINGGAPVVVETGHPLFSKLSGNIDLANDTAGEITVTVVTHWTDSGKPDSTNTASDKLPKPGSCEGHESTTSTTTPPSSSTLPTSTTSPQETTTTAAAGAVTSTTGGQLPFTGAGSSEPMLLVGIALLGGGALVLLLTRSGRNTAS
jgi:hypothetical protein